MKTFETEKHNIPEGATGYREQGKYIEWFGGGFGCWRLIASNVPSLDMCDTLKPVKPIPQANIETPEEKEVLDNMAGISREHLLKMIKLQTKTIKELNEELNSSESPNCSAWDGEGLPPVGSLCKVNRDSFTYRVMYSSEYVVIVQNLDNDNTTAHGMDIILDLHKGNYTFSKPESQQQREERERLEAAYDLFCVWSDGATPCSFDVFVNGTIGNSKRRFLAIVDKTNYRKESN